MEVNGRTKLAIKNVISEYIPNPTFNVVAPTRFPKLRIVPVENGSAWVRPLLERPLTYVDNIERLPAAAQARIMGGNLAGIMRIAA